MSSKIEWTHSTWNPSIGCTKISPGCANCYAEKFALRLQGKGVSGYEDGFRLKMLPKRLMEPLKRKKPTTFFVNSMSDLFHEDVKDNFIAKVFDIMRQTPQHVYQVLTKRADRMASFCKDMKPPANAWLGVSVENIRHGFPRIDYLRSIDSSVRFLSIEPLLEDLGELDLSAMHWVIVGGESGPAARHIEVSWIEGIRDQCVQSGIPFFFKQWGAWGADGVKRSKGKNGRLLAGREWNEMPSFSRI